MISQHFIKITSDLSNIATVSDAALVLYKLQYYELLYYKYAGYIHTRTSMYVQLVHNIHTYTCTGAIKFLVFRYTSTHEYQTIC